MGNTDSIPVVSQGKSLVQYIGGDSQGALATQENFAYRNTFPVVSQIASMGYAIDGKMDEARDLQEKFAQDMDRVIDSIPVAGHVKGSVHFALGQNERGEEAMKAASRSTGVVAGGIGGFFAGGPVGAVAGGVAGGVGMDSIITASEILVHGPSTSRPYGYYKLGEEIANGEIKTIGQGFDAAMVPVFDGVSGYVAGSGSGIGASKAAVIADNSLMKMKARPIASDLLIPDIIAQGKPKAGGGTGAGGSVVDILPPKKLALDLEQIARNNRANQLNPNHVKSGPGRPAGYKGTGTNPDLNNHANQMNSNHPSYQSSRNGNGNPIPVENPIVAG